MVISRDDIRTEIAAQLEIPATSIADDADLIQLGLDSIRTMKLAGGWRRRGFDIHFARLAAHPTIASWHDLLDVGRSQAAEEPSAAGDIPAAHSDSTPGPRGSAAADAPFPLAPMQHAYWIGRGDATRLGGVAAHLYVEFDGAGIDPAALERAVGDLVELHPMLRTRFLADGTQQTMPRPTRPVWTLLDLRTHRDTDARLAAVRTTKTHQRLAVEDGQVLDVTLTLLPAGRTRLHLDVDMLAADAMSYRTLVADLAALYAGAAPARPGYTYRDYLADRAAAGDSQRVADRAWWQQRLPDLPDAPTLPTVPQAQQDDVNRTVRYHYWLDATATATLRAGAHRRGITPAMALASVFAETIGGWSTQKRFLLNVPLFGREPLHPDVDRLVGDFTSSVLLDVDVSRPSSVEARARALQTSLHTAAAHTAYSGLDVLRDLGRQRNEPVLAPIVYTSALDLGELFADTVTDRFGDPVWIVSQGPQVMLDAQVTEVRGGLLLNWDVRESAFCDGVVDAMFARYRDAVTRLSQGDAAWAAEAVGRLPIEQRAIRTRTNDTDADFSPRALHADFFDRAFRMPELPAVLGDRDERLSYGTLAAEALTVAGALVAAGVAVGDAVAIQLPKGPEQIIAVLGVLAAGATYVPIGSDQPRARRDDILGVAGARVLIGPDGLDIAMARRHPKPLGMPVFPDPRAAAYVLFTSGSTGTPKGVEVPHRAAMNTIDDLNDRFRIGTDDRALALSALEFDLSVYDIFGMLGAGGAVVVPAPGARHDPQRWRELIRHHRVTLLNCVPSLLDMLLTAGGSDRLADSMRVVLLGGDWVGMGLARRLADQAPGCRFVGLGGTTETAIHSTIHEVRTPDDPNTVVPYGIPLRNVRCRVVGAAGFDCPDWVAGELWIGGAGVANGYLGDPERTASRFVDHAGLRWYRTGDLARYRCDGVLEFLGRADNLVKLRGYRIELGEVENGLRGLSGVRHAVAVVVDGPAPRLAAAVTVDRSCDPAELRAELASRLPGYMIPTVIEILERMPLTGNGKLDRTAVRSLLAADALPDAAAAPRTDLEAALVDILAGALGVAQLGVDTDFFAAGGDSVLATTAIARIRDWLDTPGASVSDLFAAPTVVDLAARLVAAEPTADRLSAVAALYLEVAAMTDAEVLAAAAEVTE